MQDSSGTSTVRVPCCVLHAVVSSLIECRVLDQIAPLDHLAQIVLFLPLVVPILFALPFCRPQVAVPRPERTFGSVDRSV